MPRVLISAPAQAYAENPRARDPITDRKTLARLHGLASEQACAETFDEPPLSELGISGGRLRFVLDEAGPRLRITTAYHVPRRLTDDEMQLLVKATKAQWSDGSGSGSFKNFRGTVLSTALAMAILNSDPSRKDLGAYFVDAYPLYADDETRVEFQESDGTEKTDLDYLQEAAGFGDPHAQFVLARRLENGHGLEKNPRLAFENYQKAAAQSHLSSLAFLGLCFQRGVGTAPDLRQGFECFGKAAAGGLSFGMHCLGDAYFEGRGVAANPAEGIRWYRRGMELGDLGCTAELADCCEFGKGTPKDLHQALELYQRCKEGGFDAVEPALNRVKQQLHSGEAT
jgi:TPR repeat protein